MMLKTSFISQYDWDLLAFKEYCGVFGNTLLSFLAENLLSDQSPHWLPPHHSDDKTPHGQEIVQHVTSHTFTLQVCYFLIISWRFPGKNHVGWWQTSYKRVQLVVSSSTWNSLKLIAPFEPQWILSTRVFTGSFILHFCWIVTCCSLNESLKVVLTENLVYQLTSPYFTYA